MLATGNGNPRSLSLRDPAWVGWALPMTNGSLTGRLESRFLFMLLPLALMGESLFYVYQ